MDFLKEKAGPLLYIFVAAVSIWFFYWFGALYH